MSNWIIYMRPFLNSETGKWNVQVKDSAFKLLDTLEFENEAQADQYIQSKIAEAFMKGKSKK